MTGRRAVIAVLTTTLCLAPLSAAHAATSPGAVAQAAARAPGQQAPEGQAPPAPDRKPDAPDRPGRPDKPGQASKPTQRGGDELRDAGTHSDRDKTSSAAAADVSKRTSVRAETARAEKARARALKRHERTGPPVLPDTASPRARSAVRRAYERQQAVREALAAAKALPPGERGQAIAVAMHGIREIFRAIADAAESPAPDANATSNTVNDGEVNDVDSLESTGSVNTDMGGDTSARIEPDSAVAADAPQDG